jgi:hypothetical protein
MRCGNQGHHGRHGHGHSGNCGCGHGHHGSHKSDCGCHSFQFGPCFATQEEKIAWLEQYLEGLQKEAATVEERIAKLKEE